MSSYNALAWDPSPRAESDPVLESCANTSNWPCSWNWGKAILDGL